MKNSLQVAIAAMLLCTNVLAQEKPAHSEWELGVGGSMMNLNRVMVSDFRQTAGGDYVFLLKEKMICGGADFYSALALREWLFVDAQATLGLARHFDDGQEKQGCSLLAGPGIQFRPFVKSSWVQPYVRLGINYFCKNFSTGYFGQFKGDVTNEGLWKAEDAWNKGLTVDSKGYVPASAGVGVIAWLGNRVGVRLQGQYLHSLSVKGANFGQVSAGIIFRTGGKDKRMISAQEWISSHPEAYPVRNVYQEPIAKEVVKEVIREVPVEKIVEKIVEKPILSEVIIAELFSDLNFEYDKAELTEDSQAILDEAARLLDNYKGKRFLIAGHTDAKGDSDYNEALSHARATAVLTALVQRGVPESMLCAHGFGERMAVIPETETEDVRKGDRKVTILPVSDDYLWKYLNK